MRFNESDRPLTKKERFRFVGTLCVLAGLALATSSGCELFPPTGPRPASGYVSKTDAADATFKIYVDTAVVPHADQDSSTDDGFTNPDAPEPQAQHQRSSGTAWVVANGTGRAYVMTAGHMCETRTQIETHPDLLDRMFGAVPEKLDVLGTTYKLEASDGTVYEGLSVLEDDDNVDVCVLAVGAELPGALPIADRDPDYGAAGYYVGAPRGYWGGGFAGIYDLTYSGRGAPFRGACNGTEVQVLCDNDAEMFSSAQAQHGASGSAAIVNGRVVGVINLVPENFPTIAEAVPWDVLRRVLARAMHM